ncbi:MAG: hypothetical protein GXO07_04575 [Crenarchaeota archaeon]|nr:hypothetical protein [Thermoproteota archaeon]
MRIIIALMALALLAHAACEGDSSPPSPELIIIRGNLLTISGLSDPCKVATLEVIVAKGNLTSTVLSTQPGSERVNALVELPLEPPITLTIRYSDGAGNVGSLTWNIKYYPYIAHTLEQMIVQGTRAVVVISPPPARPALPPELGDVNVQTTTWLIMATLGFALGLIRYVLSRRSS